MRAKLLILLAFVVFLPCPPAAVALALSDVELGSYLNQRLAAQIRLLDLADGELDNLNISVSEIIDKVARGMPAVLRHEVVTEGSNYYLRITSRDVIREPILNLVVELDWPKGHLIRNYALIIDPQ